MVVSPAPSFPLAASLALALLLPAVPAQNGWTQAVVPAGPGARGWHGLSHDVGRSRTVLFGGWNSGVMQGDTWEWNGTVWAQVTPAQAPSARCCHGMAYDFVRGRVVLFGGGGTTSGNDLDDTWEFDGVTWTPMQPANRPSPRRMTKMALDLQNGGVLLFGGGLTNAGVPVYGDTWLWNGNDWTLRQPATSPPARWCHDLAADLGSATVVLCGGQPGASTAPLADTWIWNGSDWRLQAGSPPPRINHGMAYDATQGAVVLWGGETSDTTTWLWDGGAWRPDPRSGMPSARAPFALAHDLVRGRTVLFGGWLGGAMGETWEYAMAPLSRWLPGGAGCGGSQGVPALLATTLPILGGTFTLELGYGTGAGLGAFVVGLSDQQWSGGALPFDLGPNGMPGCFLRVSPDFTGFVPLSGGAATLNWTLPNTPSLVGARCHAQAVALDPSANALGAVWSAAGTGLLGVL